MSGNVHTAGIIAQLRQNDEDEELPDDLRESARERRDELEVSVDVE